MKKVLLSMVAVATIAMTSCGGADMCECLTEQAALGEKMAKAEGEEAEKLAKEFETLSKSCAEIGESLAEGKSEEELAKMGEDLAKNCDALKGMK